MSTLIGDALRTSIAQDVLEAYDDVEALLVHVGKITNPRLIGLEPGDLSKISDGLRAAKDGLWAARMVVEKDGGS